MPHRFFFMLFAYREGEAPLLYGKFLEYPVRNKKGLAFEARPLALGHTPGLLELEVYRYGILYAYWFTTLLAGMPLRHRLDHADCLLIKGCITTRTYYFYVDNRTVLVYNELADYTTLNTVLLSDYRILNVLAEVLEESSLTTGELRHLLYYDEDFFFYFFYFFYLLYRSSDLNLLVVILGVDLDTSYFLGVFYDYELFDLLDNLLRLWRRRSLLLLSSFNFDFVFNEEVLIKYFIHGYFVLSPFECYVAKAEYENKAHQEECQLLVFKASFF